MTVILDGEKMTTKESAHDHLYEQFSFPAYYGRNLDALYDLLSAISQPTQILLASRDAMIEALDTYGDEMLETFEQAAAENPNITFFIP